MFIKILKILGGAIVILGVAVSLLLFTPLGIRPLSLIFPMGNIAPINFKTLTLKDSPNQYLVCPEDFCVAPINVASPVFAIPVASLKLQWDDMLMRQPQVTRLQALSTDRQETVIQRTDWMRYPDIITVEFIPLGTGQSSLAIYSRSIYGRQDFGANQDRIKLWISDLNK